MWQADLSAVLCFEVSLKVLFILNNTVAVFAISEFCYHSIKGHQNTHNSVKYEVINVKPKVFL